MKTPGKQTDARNPQTGEFQKPSKKTTAHWPD
jgi:hypothetical protein